MRHSCNVVEFSAHCRGQNIHMQRPISTPRAPSSCLRRSSVQAVQSKPRGAQSTSVPDSMPVVADVISRAISIGKEHLATIDQVSRPGRLRGLNACSPGLVWTVRMGPQKAFCTSVSGWSVAGGYRTVVKHHRPFDSLLCWQCWIYACSGNGGEGADSETECTIPCIVPPSFQI